MTKKTPKLLVTTILLIILCSSAFALSTKNVKALPQSNNPDTTAQTSTNVTASIPLSPPSIGNSSQIIKVNSPIIPMASVSSAPASANITSNPPHYLATPPVITQPNGTLTEMSQENPNSVTWNITYWATPQSYVPQYLTATFQVAPNTFSNLGNGIVMYEPLNICFGTTDPDTFIWYQFIVEYHNDTSVTFDICFWPNWLLNTDNEPIYQFVTVPTNLMPCTVGDYYQCSFTAQYVDGTPQVTFSIENLNTQAPWSNNNFEGYTPPSTAVIYNDTAYSPASCVETQNLGLGYTVDNCPYMETTFNTDATACSPGGNGAPIGIDSKVASGNGNYYWSMLSQQYFYVSSELSSAPYGNGQVIDPDDLATNQPDGSYALIYGANAGDGGQIVGQMNGIAGGDIYVYGNSGSASPSDLWVFVSMDGNTWYRINSPIEVSGSNPQWIPIGYYADFEYLAVAGYNPYSGVSLFIGAVWASGDPSVTILAYDESTGSYVNSIPIAVDGNWVPSGNTVNLIDPDPLFYAPDSDGGGAFNCFFDGSNYYGNGASIPIVGDETITAYYNYIPSYTVTINAYDTFDQVYINPDVWIDGGYWLGYAPVTVTLSLGWHSITMDQTYGWLFMPYPGITDGTNWYNNGDPIPITSDETITGIYYMGG